ncbi:hypothetical protein CPB85DRAFT_289205 [Mucidula mucida]|nr:hypothetical protein CPB85DRAFT_289205 [Mucidula mucida]
MMFEAFGFTRAVAVLVTVSHCRNLSQLPSGLTRFSDPLFLSLFSRGIFFLMITSSQKGLCDAIPNAPPILCSVLRIGAHLLYVG